MQLPIDRCMLGDVTKILPYLPDNLVDCCITSPPYYGLRDYGVDGQIGLEQTPEEYVSKLVEVFREVRRVLKPDGTLWLIIGDSYAGSWGNSGHRPRRGWDERRERPASSYKLPGLKPKDLIGIPWRVALALSADGWYLRQDIIWAKGNPMPESVRDRCTKSHEYIFLLAKSDRYYFDNEAIKEDSVTKDPRRPYTSKAAKDLDGRSEWHSGERRNSDDFSKRYKRSVWNVNLKPFAGAHFATFPEALVEPCIKAGTSEKGYCAKCGKPWVRQVEKRKAVLLVDYEGKSLDQDKQFSHRLMNANTRSRRLSGESHDNPFPSAKTIGWTPSCDCGLDSVPGVVIDPFFGAGTVGLVAKKLGRHYSGIELNPEYVAMAKKRIDECCVKLG